MSEKLIGVYPLSTPGVFVYMQSTMRKIRSWHL